MSDDLMPIPASAYQLRRHLAADHNTDLTGAGWHELDQTHRHHHRVGADHEHEHTAAGHAQVDQLAWTVFLVVFILIGLRLLGLALR